MDLFKTEIFTNEALLCFSETQNSSAAVYIFIKNENKQTIFVSKM